MDGAGRAIGYAVEKLGQLLGDEIKLVKEVYDNVHWIRSELCWLNGFLEDADDKCKNGDNRTKIWIKDLTNIAHEAEDIVDTFMSQIETKNRQRKGRFKRIVWIPSKLVDLRIISAEILQIKSKIDAVSERKIRYGINNLGESSGPPDIRIQRNINPHLSGNNFIVGFGGPKKLILERLINRRVKKRVVVPIVGMGGLGKTTLAKMIYNSDVINDWFKYRAWLTVSEDFSLLDLLRKIIKQVWGSLKKYNFTSIDELKYNFTSIDELKVLVHDSLKEERYLIVLDDVWEQYANVWQQLESVFPDVKNGSRILITTRFISIGKSVDPSNEPYVLPFLNNKESWQLFLNTVFPSEDDLEPKCPEALETLGKDLVSKCGGLPLGVIVLGGLLLVTNPTIDAWNKVAIKWKYQDSSLQILALSYNHLPNVNMKSCFLYIGIYPEDHIIKASELTKFWIAEGFIQKEENQTFEATANDYLDEFVLRCMVQVIDRTKTSKRVNHFRIHDLFRKWCILEAQEDGFFRLFTSNTDKSCTEIIAARRLTIHNCRLDHKFDDPSYKARAILDFSYRPQGSFLLKNIGQNFKLLRVIYMTFPEYEKINKLKLLEQMSRLIHLRNLTLKGKALTYLPSSIGKLHNLQTLNIKNTSISKLPKTLYEIPDLRHLYTRGSYIKPSATWKSKNIQTLDSISAGSWMLNDFTKLLNLCKLSIRGITQNEVRGLQDSLCRLNHLKSLCLESDGQSDPSLFTSFNHHNPLSKLILKNWSNISCKFPQNLITIRLSSCTFVKGVLASLENLSDLVNLKLEDCGIHSEDEFVFSACGFQQLENLHIDEMRSLLDWKILDGALPNIKCLKIRALDWLAMLPDGLEHLKSLQKLEMDFPKRDLQKRLIGTMEDRQKIPQIPSVTLNGIQLDQYKRSSENMPSEQRSDWEQKISAGAFLGIFEKVREERLRIPPSPNPYLSGKQEPENDFGIYTCSGWISEEMPFEEMNDNEDEPIFSSQDMSGKQEPEYDFRLTSYSRKTGKHEPENMKRNLFHVSGKQEPENDFGYTSCSGWISEEMPFEEMNDNEDEPIFSSQDMSGGEYASYIMGKTKVTVIKKMEASLCESEYKVILEVMGVNPIGNRPGVDFVTVLLIDPNNLELAKLAIKFFIQKLSSSDRLSIVITSPSAGPIQLLPLRQITETFLVEVESSGRFLDFTTGTNSVYGDIASCIEKGLEVLRDRRFTTWRKAALMLMSDGIHKFYDNSIPQAHFLNIPVYTFGLGEDCDPRALKQISSLTMGGTFSCIRNSDDLSIAFSQSFGDLFGIANRDLKLTVNPIESTILTVLARNCTQSTDNVSGVITINFGDLYVNERRRIEVDLRLPAVESHCSNNVLEIISRVADAVVQRSIFIDVARVDRSVEEDLDDYMSDDRDGITILPDSPPHHL